MLATADVTCMQSVLCVPDSDAVPVEILFSRAMNFKLHVHLPVLQVTRLQARNKRTYLMWKHQETSIKHDTHVLTEWQYFRLKSIHLTQIRWHLWYSISCQKKACLFSIPSSSSSFYQPSVDRVSLSVAWLLNKHDAEVKLKSAHLSLPQCSRWIPAYSSHPEWVGHTSSSPACSPRSPTDLQGCCQHLWHKQMTEWHVTKRRKVKSFYTSLSYDTSWLWSVFHQLQNNTVYLNCITC